jgi:hypothetical protein
VDQRKKTQSEYRTEKHLQRCCLGKLIRRWEDNIRRISGRWDMRIGGKRNWVWIITNCGPWYLWHETHTPCYHIANQLLNSINKHNTHIQMQIQVCFKFQIFKLCVINVNSQTLKTCCLLDNRALQLIFCSNNGVSTKYKINDIPGAAA